MSFIPALPFSGLRVTAKSRPRFDSPFTWGAGVSTVEDIEEDYKHWGLIGPIEFQDAVRVIWRIATIHSSGTWSNGGGPESLDYVGYRVSDSGAEKENAVYEGVFGTFQSRIFATWTTLDLSWEWEDPEVSRRPNAMIDENGKYWLAIRITVGTESAAIAAKNYLIDGNSNTLFSGYLTLASGTIPIRFFKVGTESVDIAFIPHWWFPYATKSGDPAWNPETGDPVNGGPFV